MSPISFDSGVSMTQPCSDLKFKASNPQLFETCDVVLVDWTLLAASGADASVLKLNLRALSAEGGFTFRGPPETEALSVRRACRERRLVMLRGREPSRSIAKCSNGRRKRK